MIRHTYRHEGSFGFEAGGSITNLEVVYHTSPQEYSKDKKVIWLCHALTASSDPEGEWWPALVGPGKTIDTNKYFVICANVLGSACGSSGPASLNPATGKPYYFDFPKVTVHDTVVAFDLLREHLGIEKIDLIVSTSMGGFMTFDWLAWKPELFDKVFFIGPDFWEGKKNPLFKENKTLLAKWRKSAQEYDGVSFRVGRWQVPGEPIAIRKSHRSVALWAVHPPLCPV